MLVDIPPCLHTPSLREA